MTGDVYSCCSHNSACLLKRIRVQTNVDQTQVPVWGTEVQSGVPGLGQEISWGKIPQFCRLASSFKTSAYLNYSILSLPDPQRGPVGSRGFSPAISGHLWNWLSESAVLPRPVGPVLWQQQREERPASRLCSGPHGLPVRQVCENDRMIDLE